MASVRIRLGITGTQLGMTKTQFSQLKVLYQALLPIQVNFGDCIGVDEEAFLVLGELGIASVAHLFPCDIEDKRAHCEKYNFPKLRIVQADPKPPLERNKDIVDNCDFLIAMPKSQKEELRSGTWATIRYAQKVERPVMILV